VPQVDRSSERHVSDGQHARIDRGEFFRPIAVRAFAVGSTDAPMKKKARVPM
jgi:hypothetical protein